MKTDALLLDFIDTTFAYAAQKAKTLDLTIGEKLHAALQLNHTHRKIRGGILDGNLTTEDMELVDFFLTGYSLFGYPDELIEVWEHWKHERRNMV